MAGKMVLYKLVVLGDGGVGKTALTIQLTLQHFVETVRNTYLAMTSSPCCSQSPGIYAYFLVVRSDYRRLVQKTSGDRWTIMHARSPRYCWAGRIYGPERPMDSRWRGLCPRLQHFIKIFIHTNSTVSQPDPTGQRVISIFTQLPRLTNIIGSSVSACPHNVGWKQE
jgi:GTPase SAR1 family protein